MQKKKKNYGHHVYFPITPPCYMLVHRTDGRPARSPCNHSSPSQLVPSPFMCVCARAHLKLLLKLLPK